MLKRAHWFGVGGIAVIVPLLAILHQGCQPTCQVQSDCPDGTFCFLGPMQCAMAVPLGFCTDISEFCSDATVAVCGCNDKTYVNACAASQHDQSYAATGACIPPQCSSTADCPNPKEEVCLFTTIGTCAGQGVMGSCAAPMKSCGNTLDLVCGCDGVTYQNLCEMQKHTSELLAGGCPCQDNSQCGAEQYCAYTAVGAGNGSGCLEGSPVGACAFKPTSCTPVQQPVCGCDGNTYDSPCVASVSGVNVAVMGPCTASILPDGGVDGG